MRFKVGDRVRIKDIDWYNENKNHCGEIPLFKPRGLFVPDMSRYCNNIMTIKDICYGTCYRMKEDFWHYNWTDEMIEGLVEEETKPNIIEEAKTYWDSIKDAWICPEGYIFKDENGNVINATKIVLEKKKKEYPKTYEECCKVLGVSEFEYNHTGTKVWYRHKLMATLDKLMLCRDAYWKIAGEEMGLGKPWEPDWDVKDNHFYTIHTFNGKIECSATAHRNAVLIFPTEEMRDEFYENFKELIEQCKELL